MNEAEGNIKGATNAIESLHKELSCIFIAIYYTIKINMSF